MSFERLFVAAIALREGDALVRIPVAKLGTYHKGKTKFQITRQDMADLVANFRGRGADTLIDYEHASEFPSVALSVGLKAAGWVKQIEDGPDADGILWAMAEFTPDGRAAIERKEYRYLSPLLAWGDPDKTTGKPMKLRLRSMGLVNQPFLDAMPAIALSEGWVAEATGRSKTMAVKQVVLAERASGKVRVILDDDTESLLSVEGLEAPPKLIVLSEAKRDKDGRIDLASLTQEKEAFVSVAVLSEMEADRELDEAVKAGKILPAQRAQFRVLALSDMAGFRTLVASMKQQIPLGERGIAGGGDDLGDLEKLDARLTQLTKEKMAADTSLSYGQAFRLALSEHPELRERRLVLMRGE